MPLIEIFRSPKAVACEHRAFVLKAVGIGSEIVRLEDGFVLFVEPGAVAIARDQLERYYAENAAPIVSLSPPPTYRHAWVAPSVYTALVLLVGFLAGRDFFGFDWYEAGSLSRAIQMQHEWWRTITALTLHVDHQHLLSNIGFGALFLYAAARLIGSGVTLASTAVAAILGNLLDSALMPQNHVSVGASTLVFATLGLVSAYSWRIQFNGRLRWAHRWAPLVVGVMLLGFLGASGENTDVLAHLTGFFCGASFGVLLARTSKRFLDNPFVQTVAGLIPVALFGGAWFVAAH
jgi:membrane associated rhomboid family serine protease